MRVNIHDVCVIASHEYLLARCSSYYYYVLQLTATLFSVFSIYKYPIGTFDGGSARYLMNDLTQEAYSSTHNIVMSVRYPMPVGMR